MPEWPGGPCPACGEDMPARLIHCRTCRMLLNQDLQEDSVEIPTFIPFEEVASKAELTPRGVYTLCPACQQELRINLKYDGQRLCCKHCDGGFQLETRSQPLKAYYGNCPHCREELRIAPKYLVMDVACKFCNEMIHLHNPLSVPTPDVPR